MTTRCVDLLRRALACGALAALLAGCTQGYPGDDAPHVSPFDMSNAERLAALNRLAQQAHPDRRWRYTMTAPCELDVEVRGKGVQATRTALTLVRAMDAGLVFDKENQAFRVVLLAGSHRGAEVVATLMESRAWTAASQAELILKLLTRDCAKPDPEDGRQPAR